MRARASAASAGTVAGLIVGIFEGVAGVPGIDLGVDGLAYGLHGGGEGVHGIGRNAFVLSAEVAEHAAWILLRVPVSVASAP